MTAAKMKECRWLKPVLVGQFEFLEWIREPASALQVTHTPIRDRVTGEALAPAVNSADGMGVR